MFFYCCYCRVALSPSQFGTLNHMVELSIAVVSVPAEAVKKRLVAVKEPCQEVIKVAGMATKVIRGEDIGHVAVTF